MDLDVEKEHSWAKISFSPLLKQNLYPVPCKPSHFCRTLHGRWSG
jgi:hypothetical protein